ncbi:ATPase [Luxibacter massiliensis]|uniref:ATPase n=1 Tax=Luxibacter massiliensis TaxID=2219695 RepID=UPI000F0686EB|nr:ATPase [Luxibacter massiliensis]
MIEETIKAIRETEGKAGAIVKDADAQCKRILEDASREAKELGTELTQKEDKRAEAAMEDAVKKGGEVQKAALAEVENEIKGLKQAALAKEEEAVSLVISQLV